MEISSKKLCEGLPEEFEKLIEYVKNLEYLELPDYEKLRGYFNSILRKEHFKFDYIYDWTTVEERLKRRVVTPRSEIDSMQNKKSTFATYNKIGDSREENNEPTYNNIIKKNNNTRNIIREEIDKSNSIFDVKTYKRFKEIKEEEEEIIIPQRKNNKINNINNKEEEVCCSTGCNIF